MAREIVLECSGITHHFGDNRVLFEVNFKIVRGEIVGLVGPSGCGKSTLLRAIVGTHPPGQGQVLLTPKGALAGEPITGPGRDRGIVYQQYSLFPFLTAQENVAIGPMLDQTIIPFRAFRPFKWRKLRRQQMDQAAAMLEQLKLSHANNLYPDEMSGGMRQRVAIAQALIMKPEILLLDEPFGALDEATREDLQIMLLTLYQENLQALARNEPPPYTILIVTHELNEAIYVGDRVVALSQYWDWRAEGFDRCPGAAIIYDRVAPVFSPGEEKKFDSFADQRRELRTVAFNPEVLLPRAKYNLFWDEVAAGKGQGVLA
jgi:NitT/TauT family transport system ATP-binding protein